MGTAPIFIPDMVVTAADLAFLADPPRVSAAANAAQSIPNAAFTGVVLQVESEDNDAMFTPGDDRMTIRTPGRWLIAYTVPWAANSTGSRLAGLYRNGVEVHRILVPAGTITTDLSSAAVLRLALNDVVQVVAYQTSGAALNTGYSPGSGAIAQMSAQWLGK